MNITFHLLQTIRTAPIGQYLRVAFRSTPHRLRVAPIAGKFHNFNYQNNSTKLKLFNFIENLLHEFDPLNSTKIQASELHRTTAHSPVLVKFLSLNHFKFHRIPRDTRDFDSCLDPYLDFCFIGITEELQDSLNKIEQEKLSSRTFVKHIESSIKSSPKSRRT